MANRILALVVALGLITVAVILAVEVIAFRTGAGPVVMDWQAWYRWAQRTGWNAGSVRLVSALLCAVGLVLIVVEAVPRRRARWTTEDGDRTTDMAYTRRGVAQAVATAVTGVGGITGARVKVRRRRIRVRAKTGAREPAVASAMRQPVYDAARSRIDGLRLRRHPSLAVRVATKHR